VLTKLLIRIQTIPSDEDGQTSAEYALVLLGAASVALLITAWAGGTDKIGDLLDTLFDAVTEMVG
jgi:Flp pilus assembly pilin Flp